MLTAAEAIQYNLWMVTTSPSESFPLVLTGKIPVFFLF